MSFVSVLSGAFGALLSSPSALFAIFALVGVLLGYGIYQLLCYFHILP